MAGGFDLVRNGSSSEFAGTLETYALGATHIILAVGDAVVLDGESEAITGRGTVKEASVSSVTGIIESIAPDLANESLNNAGGVAANASRNVHLITDINSIFDADVSNGPLVVGDVGHSGFHLRLFFRSSHYALPSFRTCSLSSSVNIGILSSICCSSTVASLSETDLLRLPVRALPPDLDGSSRRGLTSAACSGKCFSTKSSTSSMALA